MVSFPDTWALLSTQLLPSHSVDHGELNLPLWSASWASLMHHMSFSPHGEAHNFLPWWISMMARLPHLNTSLMKFLNRETYSFLLNCTSLMLALLWWASNCVQFSPSATYFLHVAINIGEQGEQATTQAKLETPTTLEHHVINVTFIVLFIHQQFPSACFFSPKHSTMESCRRPDEFTDQPVLPNIYWITKNTSNRVIQIQWFLG